MEHYSIRAIRRFEDAWKSASLSVYQQRDLPATQGDHSSSRHTLVQCVRTADLLIRQACEDCGVTAGDLEEQLRHIKWPVINADADLVTFDDVLATVTWLAKYTGFKVKRKDAKKKEVSRNPSEFGQRCNRLC